MMSNTNSPYFIGIDIGTQGARVVLMDAHGKIHGTAEEAFPLNDQFRQEQSPFSWWKICEGLLRAVIAGAQSRISVKDIVSVGVTSTSGTVIPLDEDMNPLHNALMYSDPRSANEGKLCSETAKKFNKGGYAGFNSSSGLSKIVWFTRTYPEKVSKIASWAHAADYITGRLSGVWRITDHTNALKTGFDVGGNFWPDYLFSQLNLKREWLPEVVPSGTPVGNLKSDLASELGLSGNIKVVAGITDGCASQIASGAVRVGDWNTTIGTTLVVKGVTEKPVIDPLNRLYNHRHPEGYWMPGGAANIGADWITSGGYSKDLDELNEEAGRLAPTKQLAYPLTTEGERFPFVAPSARGFYPSGLSRGELYTAGLEGVAYIERFAFQMIESLSGEKVKAVYTAGGGSNSEAWVKIRSNVLQLPLYKMKHVSGGVGAAVLAASKTFYTSLVEATKAMTIIEKEIAPERALSESYEESYQQFISLLKKKGYIQNEPHA